MTDSTEKVLANKFVYDGEGNRKLSSVFEDWSQAADGELVSTSAAAPGTGKTVYRITRVTEDTVFGVVVENTVRILEPSEVE